MRINPMKHIPIAHIAAVLLILSLGVAGCRSGSEGEAEEKAGALAAPESVVLTPEAVRTAGILTAEAEYLPVVRTVRAPGEVSLDPRRRAHVTARSVGRIESLAAYPGERVEAGQVLLSLYSPDFLMLQTELVQAADRLKRPFDDTAEQTSSEALVASIKDRLRTLGLSDENIAGIEKAGVPLPLLPVRAPMPGTVVESPVTAGDRVELGASLFRIADLSTVRAALHIYEKDLASVRVGSEAVLRTASAPGREYKGRIFRMGNVVDEKTRTVEALVDLPNPDGTLRQGLYLEADIAMPAGENAVFVPEAAVLEIGDRKVVFVLTGENAFTLRDVTTGSSSGGRVEIVSGLKGKETVASAGSFFIKSELLKNSMGEE
jgi:membrane fusion protein, copper/silver efflux system